MASERKICCCVAATWSRVIAWIQIVAGTFCSYYFSVVAFTSYQETKTEKKIVQIIILIVPPYLVFTMGIILLIGTNQKRVGYLRAWIIYEGAAIGCAILYSILSYSPFDLDDVILMNIIYIAVIALNNFALAVVCIHLKEITEGVFDLRHKRPVTMPLERTICSGGDSTWTPVFA